MKWLALVLILALAIGCPLYCENCDPNSVCLSCKAGYTLNQGNCMLPARTPNCRTFDSNGKCVQCQDWYYLALGSVCHPNNPTCLTFDPKNGACLTCYPGYVIRGATCVIVLRNLNCKRFIGEVCQQCAKRFYMSNQKCEAVSPLCQTYESINGSCVTCYPGYILNQGSCYPGDPGDPGCIKFINKTCQQCYGNYYFDSSKKCVEISRLCKTADKNNGNCLSCYPGYSLNNGECIISSPPTENKTKQDPNCKATANGTCVSCYSGYFLNYTKKCQLVDPSCRTFDYSTHKCTNCYAGYILKDDFTCYFPSGPNNSDPSCNSTDKNGSCTSCKSGYSLSQTKQCLSTKCQFFNPNNPSQCWTCKSKNDASPTASASLQSPSVSAIGGWSKIAYCLIQTFDYCQICLIGYQLSPDRHFCFNRCICSSIVSNLCTSCHTGFLLVNGNCISEKAPINQTKTSLLDCLNFENDGSCTSCKPGYFLNQAKKCGSTTGPASPQLPEVSAISYFYRIPFCDDQIGEDYCRHCMKGYILSSDHRYCFPKCYGFVGLSNICTSCASEYKLIDGDCILQNITANSTSKPLLDCIGFDNGGICNKCNPGYYLQKNKQCRKIDPLCRGYTGDYSGCATCYPGYLLSGIQCIILPTQLNFDPYCVKTQGAACLACAYSHYLASSGVCAALNPLCKVSNLTNGNCLSCYSGYTISGNTCIIAIAVYIPYCKQVVGNTCAACIDGYYRSNGTCAKVNVLCGTYDQSNGNCLSCIPGYYFSEGQCAMPWLGLDPNCQQYSNRFCIQCRNGYALVDYWCTAIDPNCLQFNPTTNRCSLCKQGLTPLGINCI